MWRLSVHKERTGGAPGREVELLLGGTQQKDPAQTQLHGGSEWIFKPAVWRLCVASFDCRLSLQKR